MLNLLLVVLAVTIPPPNDTRIVDQASLLSQSQAQELASLFQDAQSNQGVRLGLLTVTDLDDDPKAVAVRAINFWQMTPDSVLLLISTNPRKVYLQPGSNLQYRFTESTSVGVIRDHIIPALKSGRYGAGILNGFSAITQLLPGKATSTPNTPSRPEPTTAPTASEPEKSLLELAREHEFLAFLFISGSILGIALLIRTIRRRKQEQETASEPRRPLGERALGAFVETVPQSTSVPTQSTTIVNSSNDNFTTGLLVGTMLNNQPRSSYTPPPESPPRHSHRHSSSNSDSSSSSSWDSSSSSGGGGSDWGSSGGGFDSSGGGGGGGSDW